MKKISTLISILFLYAMLPVTPVKAQVGIGTTNPDPSSILELNSVTAGFLAPRMKTEERTKIDPPTEGLLVYDTDTKSFWYSKNAVWTELSYAGDGIPWTRLGTKTWLTNPADFVGIGTTNPTVPLVLSRTTGPAQFNIEATGANQEKIQFRHGGTDVGSVYNDPSMNGFTFYGPNDVRLRTSTGSFIFYKAGSPLDIEMMRIANDGNVGLGVFNPSQRLAVGGTFGIVEGGTIKNYFTVFQGGDQSANITYTLPTAAPGSNGQVLSGTTAGVLSWATPEAVLSFNNGLTRNVNTVTLGGDLTASTTITQNNAEALTFANSGTGNTIINLTSTGDFQVQDNGTQALTVTDGGLVGVGTASPAQKLAVAGTLGIQETGGTPTYYTVFQGGDQSANITYTLPTAAPGSNGQVLSGTTAGVLSWATPEAVLSFNNGLTRNVNTVTLGGDLTASTTITQNNAEVLTFANSGTGNTIINLTSTGDFQVQDNGTQALTVTDGGLVGVGTASPAQKLAVAGTLGILESGSTPTNYTIFQGGDQTGAITYTLPVDDGTVNQFLQTNGSGVLSWQNATTTAWGLTGNASTTIANNFLGTSDNSDFAIRTGASTSQSKTRLLIKSTGAIGIGVTEPSGIDGLFEIVGEKSYTGFWGETTGNMINTYIHSTGTGNLSTNNVPERALIATVPITPTTGGGTSFRKAIMGAVVGTSTTPPIVTTHVASGSLGVDQNLGSIRQITGVQGYLNRVEANSPNQIPNGATTFAGLFTNQRDQNNNTPLTHDYGIYVSADSNFIDGNLAIGSAATGTLCDSKLRIQGAVLTNYGFPQWGGNNFANTSFFIDGFNQAMPQDNKYNAAETVLKWSQPFTTAQRWFNAYHSQILSNANPADPNNVIVASNLSSLTYGGTVPAVTAYGTAGFIYDGLFHNDSPNKTTIAVYASNERVLESTAWAVMATGPKSGGNHPWTQISDMRTKKNIHAISNPLDLIMRLNGVVYEYKQEDFAKTRFPQGPQIGFIAQEVKQVLPEAVQENCFRFNESSETYSGMTYETIIPVLVEAVKQQQAQISEQQMQIEEQQKLIQQLLEKMK